MADEEEVRVGDRYLRGEDKITITAIDGSWMEYAVLREGHRTPWHREGTLPLSTTWVKVAAGPVEKLPCVLCGQAEPEMGMLFCPQCIDEQAVRLSQLSQVEVHELIELQRLVQKNGDR